VLVAVDTDREEAVFRKGRVLYVGDESGVARGRSLKIESFRPVPTGGILRLVGVESREDADGLRGSCLLIPADEAQPAGADEVHYRDLIGMIGREGDEDIGAVEDILELPTGQLLLVFRSPEGKEILVPFVRDLVVAIDRRRGILKLALPPGLREL
jgi:16S rRNA processing protein RimM